MTVDVKSVSLDITLEASEVSESSIETSDVSGVSLEIFDVTVTSLDTSEVDGISLEIAEVTGTSEVDDSTMEEEAVVGVTT